jgi:hypothetical protein
MKSPFNQMFRRANKTNQIAQPAVTDETPSAHLSLKAKTSRAFANGAVLACLLCVVSLIRMITFDFQALGATVKRVCSCPALLFSGCLGPVQRNRISSNSLDCRTTTSSGYLCKQNRYKHHNKDDSRHWKATSRWNQHVCSLI